MNPITFTVLGPVAGKGSRTTGKRRDGSTFTRPDNPKQRSFAQAVAVEARIAGVELSHAERGISVVWYSPRPASHLRADGSTRPGAPLRPSDADRDKVLRNICDALEGIAWPHDRLVRVHAIDAHFGAPQRCEITVFDCPRGGRWIYQELEP